MTELGWKSVGVLELTALPSLDTEQWVPQGPRGRRAAGGRRRRALPVPLDAGVRAGGPAAVADRHGLGGTERGQHGADPGGR